MYEYVGNLHIHTTYSDGHGTVPDVARAARGAGLDYIGLADHAHMLRGNLPSHEGGYRHGVLVCVGTEFHGAHSHYLAWGLNGALPGGHEDRPQDTIDAVRAAGGIGFLAHPFDRGTPLHDGGHAFPWRHWSVNGFSGLGIWNLGAEYKRLAQTRPQAALARALLSWADLDPLAEDLAHWDRLNRDRRVVGIGESDNHAAPVRLAGGLVRSRVLPYGAAFRAVNTHVLVPEPWSGDAQEDRPAVYEALGAGRCFVANRQRGDARGFRCVVEGGGPATQMGGTVPWQPGLRLHLVAPAPGTMCIVADGTDVFRLWGRSLRWPVPGPGNYRAEVRRRDAAGRLRAWIFGNHIRVVPPVSAAESPGAAA